MKITDALRGEHAAMRPFLRFVRHATRPGVRSSKVNIKSYAAALQVSLKAHTTVEESHLLDRLMTPIRKGEHKKMMFLRAIVGESAKEHRKIEDLLGKARRTGDQASIYEAVRQTLANFDKQDREIFPVAEKVLGRRRLAMLGREWAMARAVRL